MARGKTSKFAQHPGDLPRLVIMAFARYSASGLFREGDTLAPSIVANMKGKLNES